MIAAKQMRAHGARIAVAALQPVVAEIFAISRFDRVLDVFADGARRTRAGSRARRWPPSTRPAGARGAMKRVRFWGTRGSLPVALTAAGVRRQDRHARCAARGPHVRVGRATSSAYVDGLAFAVAGTYGGHTSCVEIETGGPDYVLCDLGSGVRPFGQAALARHGRQSPQTYPHLHVPRALGPHHGPAVLRAGLHSGQPGPHLRQPPGARGGAAPPAGRSRRFRWTSRSCARDIEFVHLEPGRPPRRRRHDGHAPCCSATPAIPTATASSRERPDASSTRPIPSTSSRDPAETERFVEFFRDADLVIFDAMYSLAEAISVKADWGHSSNVVGVELCQLAGARHLCLFHHEPAFDDAAIDARARRHAAPRGDHARRRAAARQRRLRRAGNRVVTPRAARQAGRAPVRPHPPRRRRRPRRAGAR